MTLAEAIKKTYLMTDRKSTAPSTAKSDTITALLNFYKDVWADEPGVQWESLREVLDIGTVTATDSFELDDVGKISKRDGDHVTITHTDGRKSYYSIVPSTKLRDGHDESVCAVQGGSLVFEKAFTATSPQFGGTISIPQYTTPPDMTKATDVIPVDNPYYIIYRAAAEYVSNDVTKSYRAPDFIAQATEAMDGMKEANYAQIEEIEVEVAHVASGQSWD